MDVAASTPRIRSHGDPILHRRITRLDGGVGSAWLLESLERLGAIGLAANQVGLDDRFFVHGLVELAPVVINPVIISTGGKMTGEEEGCLSLVGEPHLLWRPNEIVLEYSLVGDPKKRNLIKLYGWAGRVVAHEVDHLNGITIRERSHLPEASYA